MTGKIKVHKVIVAVSDNGVIGRGGQLPWYLQQDLRRFKELTMHSSVVMGHETFKALPGNGPDKLPGRQMCVVSASAGVDDFRYAVMIPVVYRATSYDRMKSNIDRDFSSKNYYWIGGQSCFDFALKFADEVLVTRVHVEVDGDAFFQYNLDELGYYRESARPVVDTNINTTFEIWKRIV